MKAKYGKRATVSGVVVTLLLFGAQGYAAEETQQKAEAIAEKVERKSEQTEKAEGKDNLVEDSVKVKETKQGDAVVEQVGEASYYGKGFHGKETASGEIFNQNELTAAHPTLPLGTEAKVTNLKTGKSVEVEINDRGPYTKGRDIDLSKEAAKEIGLTKDGAAPVKVEAKVPDEKESTKSDKSKDAQ
jgi:rare lipoprotein A (peptidoglycan hydrolase)